MLAREVRDAERVHPGGNFARQREVVGQLDAICGQLRRSGEADVLIASANGTLSTKRSGPRRPDILPQQPSTRQSRHWARVWRPALFGN